LICQPVTPAVDRNIQVEAVGRKTLLIDVEFNLGLFGTVFNRVDNRNKTNRLVSSFFGGKGEGLAGRPLAVFIGDPALLFGHYHRVGRKRLQKEVVAVIKPRGSSVLLQVEFHLPFAQLVVDGNVTLVGSESLVNDDKEFFVDEEERPSVPKNGFLVILLWFYLL